MVLNGYNGAPNYNTEHAFTYVERPRMVDNSQHNTNIKTFTDTAMGTLRLQGRTMYVLDGQHDYGIDFIRDAKAVVRQHEGYIDNAGKAVSDWKTRAYGSVQEAIDSLGDADKTTGEKEFKGIITAVLNSNGVAEWVVFYSDTVAETKSDTGIGQATIDVEIRTQLPGGKAEFYEIRKVARPTDGTDVAEIEAPNLSKKGFTAVQNPMYLLWKKYDERPVITFEYVKGEIEEPTAGAKAIRVQYVLTADYDATPGDVSAADILGTETVNVPLDAAGYGKLEAKLLKKIPTGFVIDTAAATPGTNTDLGGEVIKSDTPVTMTVSVKEKTVKSVKILPAARAAEAAIEIDVVHGAQPDDVKTAAKEAGLRVEVTYTDNTTRILAADADGVAWALNAGTISVTYTSSAQGASPVSGENSATGKVYAAIATSVTGDSNTLGDWTITAESGKTTNDTSVVLTFVQKTGAAFSADDAAELIGKLTDDSTGGGIKLTAFALNGTVTEGVAADADNNVAEVKATFKVTVTIAPEGDVNAASVTLNISAPTAP